MSNIVEKLKGKRRNRQLSRRRRGSKAARSVTWARDKGKKGRGAMGQGRDDDRVSSKGVACM